MYAPECTQPDPGQNIPRSWIFVPGLLTATEDFFVAAQKEGMPRFWELPKVETWATPAERDLSVPKETSKQDLGLDPTASALSHQPLAKNHLALDLKDSHQVRWARSATAFGPTVSPPVTALKAAAFAHRVSPEQSVPEEMVEVFLKAGAVRSGSACPTAKRASWKAATAEGVLLLEGLKGAPWEVSAAEAKKVFPE